MKVLITGAYGYIGKHVVTECLRRGMETLVVDRMEREHIPNVKFFKYDVLQDGNYSGLYDILGMPDVIIHLAWSDGFNHKTDSHIINLPGHYLFIKNMVDSGCKSISVMGTMHEVGYYEGEINENTPCNPMSLYGIAKNALRQALMTYVEDKDVSLKWLRGFYIVGDDKNNHSIFSKILEMSSNCQKTFPFTSGLNKYDFLNVDELAKQIVSAASQNEVDGIINCCSGKPVALKDKVEEFIIKNRLDIKPEYGKFPTRKYDSPCIYGNIDKISIIKQGEIRNDIKKDC